MHLHDTGESRTAAPECPSQSTSKGLPRSALGPALHKPASDPTKHLLLSGLALFTSKVEWCQMIPGALLTRSWAILECN